MEQTTRHVGQITYRLLLKNIEPKLRFLFGAEQQRATLSKFGMAVVGHVAPVHENKELRTKTIVGNR